MPDTETTDPKPATTEPNAVPPGEERRRARARIALALREAVQVFGIAFALYLIISSSIVQTNFIEQSSMETTLHEHDRLIAVKCTLGLHLPFMRHRVLDWGTIRRKEILLFEPPGNPGITYVKRTIALPGETVEIRDRKVFVNGSELNEPYVRGRTEGTYGPLVVPPAHYYVMGDNRPYSKDSRDFGPIPLENVQGKATVVYWPSIRMLR